MSFTSLPSDDVLPMIVKRLLGGADEVDVVTFAATHTTGLVACERTVAQRATHIVNKIMFYSYGMDADDLQYSANEFKRNLRIVNAFNRRSVHLAKYGRNAPKRKRFDDEILNAARGTNLADLEYVSDAEPEEVDDVWRMYGCT